MSWNRRNRFATVLFALLSLLFMQLAMAAHSCPGGATQRVNVAEMTTMAQPGMPCAGSATFAMDDAQSSLCAAHCKSDPQTADKYQVPALASLAAPATGFPLPRMTPPAPAGAAWQAPLLRRSTAASLAVRNCCFRL